MQWTEMEIMFTETCLEKLMKSSHQVLIFGGFLPCRTTVRHSVLVSLFYSLMSTRLCSNQIYRLLLQWGYVILEKVHFVLDFPPLCQSQLFLKSRYLKSICKFLVKQKCWELKGKQRKGGTIPINQDEFMGSPFLPKCQPKITNISALPSNKLQGQK